MERTQFNQLIKSIEAKTSKYIVLDRGRASVLIKGKKSYAFHSFNYKTRVYEWELVSEQRAKDLCDRHWFGKEFNKLKGVA